MRLRTPAQDRQRNIADADPRSRFSAKSPPVGVSVQRQQRIVRFERALEARASQKSKDRFRFADDGLLDGGVVRDSNLLLRLRLRKAVVELDGFTFRDLDEGLDPLLSKRHQFIRRKATAEALGASETNAVDFVAVSVEQVDAGEAEHAGKFVLVAAFVVVVSEDCNDGDGDGLKHAEPARPL